jgi:RNA polymerase sigma-70 factor (ECF subfamily)
LAGPIPTEVVAAKEQAAVEETPMKKRRAPKPAPDPAREENEKEDARLMGLFKKGEAKAFEQLLARHKKPVFNFCLRMLADRSAAEDALQEVFLKVVKSAKSWERQAKFTTWLYTIARNHCIDALRKASYRKTASLDQTLNGSEDDGATLGDRVRDEEGISPDRGAESERLRPKLEKALASLPEEQREVFVMREYAGMPFKDIASVVGGPENTVKSRMRYALEHLRTHLKKQGIRPE